MSRVQTNRMALVLGLLMTASGASGATFTVTNLNDAGTDSLRQAVADANGTAGADTIDFQPGLTGTITLTTGSLALTDTVSITGPGANVVTVSGNNASRVFQVNVGVATAISGLTIANGSTNAGGAGIHTEGPLTLTACILRNNTDISGTGGGGVLGGGGAALTVAGCLFTANQAVYGAAIEYYSSTQAVVTNVTVSGNTISGGDGGVIDVLGAIRLESCTVTGNSVPAGSAAVYAFGGTVQYRNTIVSANTPNQFGGSGLTSLGHNISSDGTGNLIATGDLPNTNPLLGPLADNGGPTMTHALLSGSPAIDAADTATFPATDQRGIARPLGMLNCTSVPDIGAVEDVPADCNHNGIADGCDIAASHIYWANDTADVIQRAVALPTNFNVQTVASTGPGGLRAVAVDPGSAQVYWGLADGIIRRSNLDGSGVVTLVSGTAGRAVDIALDVAGGRMYWASFQNDSIYRANLDGTDITTLLIGQNNVSGIALDLPSGKMYWVNQTSNGQIRRANLDGTNIETLISSGPVSPIDIALDIPGGGMYWAEYAGGRIRRANLDGSGMEDLATGVTNAAGVDLDLAAGKVYWSSAILNKIERANLDGTSRENVITGSGAIYRIAFIQRSADCNANGTLDECEINVPVESVYAAAPGAPIPDGNPTGISSTIDVPAGGVIADLDVFVNIPHTWQGDVIATLSHGGVTQTIINRAGLCFDPSWGYSADNFGPSGGYLMLDDGAPVGIDCYAGGSPGVPNYAGPAQPNQPLAAFNGLDSAGPWTLTVSDSFSNFAGTLATWALVVQTTVADCNGNGVPDDCEPNLHRGDMNCDCAVNLADVAPFVQAQLDPAGYTAAHPTCSITNGDMQPDGQVNGLDIHPFVEILAP